MRTATGSISMATAVRGCATASSCGSWRMITWTRRSSARNWDVSRTTNNRGELVHFTTQPAGAHFSTKNVNRDGLLSYSCDTDEPKYKISGSDSFYRASICESGLGSCNSVCPSVPPSVCLSVSVCLSHAWIVTKLNDALQIFLYHTKGQSLCYFDTNSGWWAMLPSLWNLRSKWPTPFEKRRRRPISAHNVSTVRDSENSSITINTKSTTSFPTSHRWSAYVTRNCPKGWLKERFFRVLSKSQRLIVSSAVNFVRRSVSQTSDGRP